MFGRVTVWSVLRHSKEACRIHKLRGTTPFSSYTQRPFKFLTPPVATHYFHAFRSHLIPKGHHVPHVRNFSKVATIRAEYVKGLKVLAKGGSHAETVVGRWVQCCALYVFSMVVLGGFNRLTRSGVSMTDWKFIGILLPSSDEEWLREFEKYKQSPEYKRVNRGMKIEEFKFIYWTDYAHRALGVMLALPYPYFLFKGYITLRLGLRLSALFALGAGQGLIDWWMVKSGLEEPPSEYSKPTLNPYRVAAHVTSTVAIYCGLYWTALSVLMHEQPAVSVARLRGDAKVRRLALPISLLAGLTVVYGSLIAGNEVGNAFNTFQKMAGTSIPEDIFEMKPLIRNFIENTSTVQFGHRILATATLISAGILWLSTRKLDTHYGSDLRVLIGYTIVGAGYQVILGFSTLLQCLPAYFNQLGVLALLNFMLQLNHAVRRPCIYHLKFCLKHGLIERPSPRPGPLALKK